MRHKLIPLNRINIDSSYPTAKGVTEKRNRMNRKKVYWISQISGWSIFALVNIVLLAFFRHLTWDRVLVLLYFCFSAVSFTHILRTIIKKKNWVSLILKKVIPRVIISSIIIGAIIYLILFFVDLATGTYDHEKFKIGVLLAELFQFFIVIFLWELIYFAVHYFENYKRVQIESLIWEAAVKDFELKTLKSQLNPHFMFNALNSIRALIQVDPSSAQTAVTKLSNILRYSLKMERIETVPLGEEIQTVGDYLALESIRFEERLKYNIEFDPKSGSIEIPPMMIQTLVENGIKHGISKRTAGGNISVKSEVINSHLHVKIINSGHLEESLMQSSQGFGLNNTKHRLHLLYGETASFSIKNVGENEVQAELVIPTGGIKNESFNN